jgi:exonuclease III
VGHKTQLANEQDQKQCINALKTTFFGGWNVRSCFHQAKKELIIKQLKKHRIQVAALSETAMYDSGTTTIGEYTFIYSGHSSTDKTRSAHGVAICLNKQATTAWKNLGSTWEAVNERIVMVRLACKPINVTVIAIYAPVNPKNQQQASSTTYPFYADLQATINQVPKCDMLLIIGDFNARVGQEQHRTSRNVVGPHAVDTINDNGERLVDFCSINNLIICNTFFQHKPVHQKSWMHPGSKTWHMLDYTLVNKQFRSSVEDVRVHRTAAGVIGTDHHLLRTKLKFHLKSRRKVANIQPLRVDRKNLKNEHLKMAFQAQLNRRPQQPTFSQTIDQKYTDFVDYVHQTSGLIFQQDGNGRKHKEWLTDEILDVVDKKAKAFLDCQNFRGTSFESRYRKSYCLLRNLAKKKIETRQVEYWDELSMEIENAIKQHDPATAYAMIRRLRGGRAKIENLPIFDKQGSLLTNSKDRLNRWKEYYNDLLNVPSIVDQATIQQIPPATITTSEQQRQDKTPTLSEVQCAIKQMKNGKAPGNDGISADVIKAGGLPMAKWLQEIFVDIWKNETMIEDWTTAILIRLYKNKGDKKICDNYLGISLLVVTSKIFSRIILNRVQGLLDKQLLEEQAGFRSNRSTIDQIFILKMIMEKSYNINKPLLMCFIDIMKAYDSVDRALLWQICRHYGLTEKIVRMLKLLYKDTKAQVRINGELSDPFDINSGVQQGGIPSCILFNILFDFIMRRVIEQVKLLGITGIKMAYGSNDFFHPASDNYEDLDILLLIYADDLVVMCDNTTDLELFIQCFEQVTQEFGLTMSVKKTCIMSLKQLQQDLLTNKVIKSQEVDNPNLTITIRNETIETVDEFRYLGCYVTRDQSIEKELETRLAKASTAFNMLRHVIWCRKTVSIEAKLRIFRTCVLPVLLYGSEIWSTTAAQEQLLNTFYFKCLRTLIGVNLGDHMPNEQLLQLTGQPHLSNIISRNRLRWFGHVNRMQTEDNESSMVKKAMFSYFPQSVKPRNVGNRKRWQDKISEDVEKFNIRNWRRETLDRDKWQDTINKYVHSSIPSSNIPEVVEQYKQKSQQRRAAANAPPPPKVTDVLAKQGLKNLDGTYTCPNPKCPRGVFKPQGITGHVKSCAKEWCKKNGILTK